MIKIIINGVSYEVPENITVLQACQQNDIEIPTLCYDDRLEPHSACRLCIVEVEGMRNLPTSCSLKVNDGMKISTDTERVRNSRREVLDLLFSNHPDDCLNCHKSGECKLQNYCYDYGVTHRGYDGERRNLPIDESNPFYYYDPNKCILCGKCVRVCSELQCTDAITIDERGFNSLISTPFRKGLEHSDCVSCGNCVSVCPVGALVPKSLNNGNPGIKKKRKNHDKLENESIEVIDNTKDKEDIAVDSKAEIKHLSGHVKNSVKSSKNYRHWDTEKVRTTCSYCGVGCQLDLVVNNNEIVEVKPYNGTPNDGLLCVKGKFGYKFVNHPDRLKKPLIRKNGVLVEADWNEAYNLIVSKIKTTKENYGPNSFGGFSSARCTNEENYLFQKLLRAAIGTNNVDHCARL